MPGISEFNIASNVQTDREHEVQLGLLQELRAAVRGDRDAAAVGRILEQLVAYSEAHFTSEELLMRLKSYDDYEDHVADHNHILEILQEIAADHAAGSSALVSGKAEEALAFIDRHIETRDRRLANHVRNGH